MDRHDIHLLQQIRGYPALTITLPTHRAAPQNRQDPIRVKNLMNQAMKRLRKEFTKRELEALLVNLDNLASGIDYDHALDGLVLAVNRDFARAFYLPFPLKERVVIDETFHTRDLVFAMNRTPRYWVLVLSEKPTRLFEATREHLAEIQTGGFPMTHTRPGGERVLPGGFTKNKSAIRDEKHRQFFRRVDAALKTFINDSPLPLAVIGVDRLLSFYNEVTQFKSSIVTTLTGSHATATAHELGKMVWPLVESSLDGQRRQVLLELEKANSERKCIGTVGEVWRAANEGRGRVLLVEEDYHYPARVDESDRHLSPAADPTAPDVIDDAVDEIIETVLAKQGRVVFVAKGQLDAYQKIALILRY